MIALAARLKSEGTPGPGLYWAIPLAILFVLAFVGLFSFAPIFTSIALTVLSWAAVIRTKMPVWAATLLIASGGGLFILAAALIEENTHYSAWHGERYGPNYPIDFAPWINVTHRPAYAGRVRTTMMGEEGNGVSGDVLIHSQLFEKRHFENEVRCDIRCVMLLGNENVQSVTIQPRARIWNEGPRALMPGYLPAAMAFRLSDTKECRDAWDRIEVRDHNGRWYSVDHNQAPIDAFHLALNREQPCLESAKTSSSAWYDTVFVDGEYDLELYDSYIY